MVSHKGTEARRIDDGIFKSNGVEGIRKRDLHLREEEETDAEFLLWLLLETSESNEI